MRREDNDFKEASRASDGGAWADSETSIIDWLSLPSIANASSLWDSLHDAEIISIRSNLLSRTMTVTCEIEHLREFYKLDGSFQFVLSLGAMQSARVISYAVWPGGCSIPHGLSVEEQRKIVDEYQAKWREESSSWNEFESQITRENVFCIGDAALATAPSGPMAIKFRGHLNHTTYHEVFLRFETLGITGSDGKSFTLEQFWQLGEKYWKERP